MSSSLLLIPERAWGSRNKGCRNEPHNEFVTQNHSGGKGCRRVKRKVVEFDHFIFFTLNLPKSVGSLFVLFAIKNINRFLGDLFLTNVFVGRFIVRNMLVVFLTPGKKTLNGALCVLDEVFALFGVLQQ